MRKETKKKGTFASSGRLLPLRYYGTHNDYVAFLEPIGHENDNVLPCCFCWVGGMRIIIINNTGGKNE